MSTMKIKVAAIKELEDKYGRTSAELLVKAARDKNHPLHKDFTWDDKKAAHKHRLDVAREIISSVRIIITRKNVKISCVGYVRDPALPTNQQGYVSTTQLCTEREHAEEAVLAEVSRAQSYLERAKELANGLDLEREFEAAMAAAVTLKSRLRRGTAQTENLVAA
jgi:hypothetical protein